MGGRTRDKGRQDINEQGRGTREGGLEEGIWGRRCTGERGEAGGREVSSLLSPHQRTQQSCPCTPPEQCT